MALVPKILPVGIDVPIGKIQSKLYEALVTNGTWTDYQSYHRAYKNKTKDGFKAEVFTSRRDYKDVFLTDKYAVSSFFIAPNERPPIEQTYYSADIDIIFQCDLNKLFADSPHRSDEEFHNDIAVALSNMGNELKVTGMFEGIDDVYADFDTTQLDLDDMQPFHVVRFRMNVKYDYDCNAVYATLTCNLSVVMSKTDEYTFGAGDGTATATVSGGQGAIAYLWDDPLEQTTSTAINLVEGDYSCTITDDIIPNLGCQVVGNVEVLAPAFTFMLNASINTTLVVDSIAVVTWIDDAGNTLIGTSVTFPYTTSAIKTVRVFVSDPALITRLTSGWNITPQLLELDNNRLSALGGGLVVSGNSGLTKYVPPTVNTGSFNDILFASCGLTEFMDMSAMTMTNDFLQLFNNPLTNGFINPSGTISFYEVYNTSMSGNMPFAGCTVNTRIIAHTNPNITGVTQPSAPGGPHWFDGHDSGYAGTLDLTGFGIGDLLSFKNCTALLEILLPTNSNTIGFLDVSGSTVSPIDMSSMTSLTTVNNGQFIFTNCNWLTSEVDAQLAFLVAISGSGPTGRAILMAGNNSAPTDLTDVVILQGYGFTVTVTP